VWFSWILVTVHGVVVLEGVRTLSMPVPSDEREPRDGSTADSPLLLEAHSSPFF